VNARGGVQSKGLDGGTYSDLQSLASEGEKDEIADTSSKKEKKREGEWKRES